MQPNPLIGVVYHWLGGLASGTFYVPYKGVRKWSWETFWLAGGLFSWLICPWIGALALTHDLLAVLREISAYTFWMTYFVGVLWGLGGLTFGLTMRYLGMSLGMAVALGYCAAFGTLMPPIFRGEFRNQVLGTQSGVVLLIGVLVATVGIAFAGAAGITKEREMPDAMKQAVIKEFRLKKGLLVATFCGVMSACFSYGLAAGDPIRAATLRHGTAPLWQGLPILVVVLAGGFLTNFVWCLTLHIRNKSGGEYFDSRFPRLPNYLVCALAGSIWYFQFFFYTMGETQMGVYKFSSWTLHMASIIIFSSLWGIGLHEWRGASAHTKRLLGLSICVLVLSTVVVGFGNYLGTRQ